MKTLFAVAPEPLPDIVTDDICEMAKLFPEEEGKVGPLEKNIEGTKDKSIRDCKVRWIQPDSDETKKLTNLCTNLFFESNRMFFGLDLTRIYNIQYTEYHGSNEGKYDWHHDVDWNNNGNADRKLSITIQLSDPQDYEGGTFEFDEVENPQLEFKDKGTILIFPSYLKHRVLPVTSGVRKTLVAWVSGPRWQ